MKFNRSVYQNRISRIQQQIIERALDAVLVWGEPKGSFGLLSAKNDIGYISNWPIRHPDMGPSLALITADEQPVQWITGPEYTLPRVEEFSTLSDIRLADPITYIQEVATCLSNRSITTNRIGVVRLSEIPLKIYEDLQQTFSGCDIIDVTDIFEKAKLLKSDEELSRVERSAETVDEMYDSFRAVAEPEMKESEIALSMEQTARKKGAEFVSIWITSGNHGGLAPAFEPDRMNRVVSDGDMIVAGVHIVQQNYWGHGIKAGVLGTSTTEQQAHFEMVNQAQQEIITAAAEKRGLVETRNAVADIYHQGEYSNSFRSFHGLGLSYGGMPEEPQPAEIEEVISKEHQFRPNMVFEAHPNIWDGGRSELFYATGDMVVVTETGATVLTEKQDSLYNL